MLQHHEHPLTELCRMAAVYHKLHKFEQAESIYRTVISQLEKSTDDNKQLALALFGLAEVYSDQTRYGEAGPSYKRAVDIWERLEVTDSVSLLWYSEALTKMQQYMSQPNNDKDSSSDKGTKAA